MLGLGTLESPYILENLADWNTVPTSDSYRTAHFALNADLDFGSANTNCWHWHDGTATTRFTGTLNGNGHIIANPKFVAIQKNGVWSPHCAIFTIDTTAIISDLTITGASATGDVSSARTCFVSTNRGLIQNVKVSSSTFAANNNFSSLVIDNLGTIDGIESRSNTFTGTYVCGVVSTPANGSFTKKSSSILNTITGTRAAGFMIYATTGCQVDDSYSRGCTVTGSSGSCGFADSITATYQGVIRNCYAANTIAGTAGTAFKHAFCYGSNDNFVSTNNFWDDTLYTSNPRPYGLPLTTSDFKSQGGIIRDLGEEYIYPINEYPKFDGQAAENPITITYNGNGATSGSAPANQTGESGYRVADRNTLEKTSSIFQYWNTAADGSGTTYLVRSIITTPQTLYAVWGAWSRTVNAYYAAVSTTDGTYDYPGDKQGAVLQNVGDVVKIALRCPTGKKSASALTIEAPVDCEVSLDGITYSLTVTIPSGGITDVNKYVWCKRVQATLTTAQDVGFITTPPLVDLGVVDI